MARPTAITWPAAEAVRDPPQPRGKKARDERGRKVGESECYGACSQLILEKNHDDGPDHGGGSPGDEHDPHERRNLQGEGARGDPSPRRGSRFPDAPRPEEKAAAGGKRVPAEQDRPGQLPGEARKLHEDHGQETREDAEKGAPVRGLINCAEAPAPSVRPGRSATMAYADIQRRAWPMPWTKRPMPSTRTVFAAQSSAMETA